MLRQRWLLPRPPRSSGRPRMVIARRRLHNVYCAPTQNTKDRQDWLRGMGPSKMAAVQEAGQVRQALDGIAAEVAASAPAGLFQQPADDGGVLAAQLASLHQVGRARGHILSFSSHLVCVCASCVQAICSKSSQGPCR